MSNCAQYDSAMCTNPAYAPFVAENCCMFCLTHLSGTGTGTVIIPGGGTGSGTGGTGTITGGGTGTGGTGTITGGGTGTGTGTMTGGTCSGADKIPNCADYGANVCSDASYQAWANDNCCTYCYTIKYGGGSGSGTGTMTGTGTGTGGSGSMTGSSSGCIYKGQVYSQGQTWKDGCSYSCTCNDAASGQYACKDLCYTFNMPAGCQMVGPAAGKCCQTPSCPAGITIQYPAGYQAN